MKILSTPLLLIALLLLAMPAYAAGEGYAPYVEAKLGGSFTQIDSIKNTSAVAAPAPTSKGSADEVIGVAGVAAGLSLKSLGVPMRAELEYAYHTAVAYNPNPTFVGAGVPTSFKSDLTSQTVFANVYYDFATGTAFTPYVGAGLGMAWNHTKGTGTVIATGATQDYHRTTDSFAWNVGAGCAYTLTSNWSLSAGYRYVDLGKVVWGDGTAQLTSKDITSHEVLMGLRYQF
jgi:opacity protein-like surface antigen